MKIKTITCHDVYNYGASLQAYALMKFLEEQGHDVEIINYKPSYLDQGVRTNFWFVPGKYSKYKIIALLFLLYKIPQRLLAGNYNGAKKFDNFNSQFLKITDLTFKTIDELRANPPQAHLYIAGSDQIWNTNYENGKDPSFYLDFGNKDVTRISYAASFGGDEIDISQEKKVKKLLSKLDFISVRESSGLDILNRLKIKNGVHVLDPVFLLNYKQWETIEANLDFNEKYLLVYDFDLEKECQILVEKVAKKKGLKIYAINNYRKTPYANIDFFDAGPELFLSLIKNADCVISNSFHATAFSIIYSKNFIVFNRRNHNNSSRMLSLLNLVDCDKQFVPFCDLTNCTIETIYKTKINTTALRFEIKKSISYLNDSLPQK